MAITSEQLGTLMAAMAVRKREPPVYKDDATLDLEDWITKVDLYYRDVAEAEKIKAFAQHLGGHVSSWVRGEMTMPNIDARTWGGWLAALRAEFGVSKAAMYAELNQRVQRIGEDPVAYYREKMRLISGTTPSAADEDKVQKLLQGLQPDLLVAMSRRDVKTPAEFLEKLRIEQGLAATIAATKGNDPKDLVIESLLAALKASKESAKKVPVL